MYFFLHILYIYYTKLRVHGVKTYGINGKEVQTGDWEELKKHICRRDNGFFHYASAIAACRRG